MLRFRWFVTVLLVGMALVLVLVSFHIVTLRPVTSAPDVSVVLSVPMAPAAASSVIGRPSLSAHFVDAVLAAYHSPAIGLGQAMVTDSLHFGIDDAFALAFFWHESQFGRLGVAVTTRSLGNIVCTPGYPVCVGRFRWYASWQAGCLDWFRLLAVEYLPRGLTTLEQIVPVYAPSSENDVSAYIAAVLSAVSAWRSGHVEV
ncbi:MAG TPA: hypothetical protein VNG51_02065 [Ktedonobacteraceae bacterium]|nr:hypothetical protein [Ktedonobacteraceae bacterium]